MPTSAVNDEFCDCDDGSDEPGTGACAGRSKILFYCPNDGSTPRLLYPSRVGDGICDCCDGSDEAAVALRYPSAACSNTCAEQGAKTKLETEKKVQLMRAALAQQEEIKASALGTLNTKRAELAALEAQRPALDAAYQEAKKAAEALSAAAEAKEGNDACMWRQTGSCSPDGPREESKDKKCSAVIPKGDSGFCDCDGDGVRSDSEPGFGCTGPPRKCRQACAKAMDAATKAPTPVAEEEKPPVSEYAKWMEGAESSLKAGADAETKEDPQVSEYAKWMDGAETKLATAELPAEDLSEGDEDEAKDKLDAHDTQAKSLRDEIAALEKMQGMSSTQLGYASLLGKTLSKKVSDFSYKITFFKTAKQDHTSLGTWKEWTGPRTGVFENGAQCWGGPARKLLVKFECGAEEAIIDVLEPSRCVYEATIVHPGACEQADLDELVQGTRVVGPHEEL